VLDKGTKTTEKWLIRLVLIQFIVLIAGQFLMYHRDYSPYLNKAIRSEGVIEPVKKMTSESVESPIMLWYHK